MEPVRLGSITPITYSVGEVGSEMLDLKMNGASQHQSTTECSSFQETVIGCHGRGRPLEASLTQNNGELMIN